MPAAKATKKTESAPATSKATKAPVLAKTTEAKTTEAKTTKAKATKAAAPVVAAAPTPTPEVENVVVTTDAVEFSITENFTEFIGKFQAMMTQFSALKTELKSLEKRTVKQLKVVQKLNNKKKRKATRAPSGFVKPAPISDELASFLGKPTGSEMARTDVTREINKYIRANNLQDKNNGRQINPDKQLTTLLKLDSEVVLTYFNLQKYMGPHFPKQQKAETA